MSNNNESALPSSSNEPENNTQEVTEPTNKKLGILGWTGVAIGGVGLIGGGYLMGKYFGVAATSGVATVAARALFS